MVNKGIAKCFCEKKSYLYLLSFFIPLCVILAVFFLLDIYPCGEKLFLVHDLNGQYISFFSYLQDSLKNNNDLFYSFSQVFGLDMVGTVSYYLLSPFNLLLFFCRNTELAVTWIILLKIAFCGLTMFLYLSLKDRPRACQLIFSSLYALTAYNLVYSHNLMWMDGVMLLPLIAAGIDMLFKKGNPWVYLLSLAAAVFANYYIGYMLCLFSALYFVLKLLMRLRSLKEIKQYKKELLSFAISSLCAGLLSVVVIIPTAFSLVGGKTAFAINGDLYLTPFQFISKLFPGSYDLGQQHQGVNAFCGLVTILLAILFFCNKKIALREKIISGTAVFLLIVSTMIPQLQLIWHCFAKTDGFPNRHAFILCFCMIYIAYRCFLYRDGIPRFGYILSGLIFFLLCIAAWMNHFSYLPADTVLFSLVIALATLAALFFAARFSKTKTPALIALAVLICTDLFFNAYQTLEKFEVSPRMEYYSYTNAVEKAVASVKASDSGFYRMEKTFTRTFMNRTWKETGRNDPMQFSYNGLSCFTSNQKQFVKDFCEGIGFTTFHQWSCYGEGNTRTADVLFGIKYILDKENRFDGIYEPVSASDDITVYKNPFALSVGFAANEDIFSCNLSGLNAFERQNAIVKSISGKEADIFTSASSVTISPVNFEPSHDGVTWRKTEPSQDGYIEYTITAGNGDPLYAYFPSSMKQNADIECNGKDLGRYFDYFRHDIVYLGRFTAGETVTFRIKPHGDKVNYRSALFYHENLSALAAFANEASAGNCNFEKLSSSHLKGTVTAGNTQNQLLLTIPVQEGWHIYIDGQETDYQTAFGIFIAIPVTPGQHEVEIKYIPPGLNAGITITLIILVFVVFLAFLPILRRKFPHIGTLKIFQSFGGK